ncbi:hypothetical protein H6F86_21265 [Phormidium sp. FACHB-592]|uniref:Uncharacterized protein n=1 Tax=Stenomitos frigidus AS-A4 TaxID=2933935 RepID=A0ABV0KEU4_9CYAN|nr:hypothetical protein [Phormidium sp. FACHB-592]MBD2076366.1 hypothetical protein [Phormidium sp. FACHB-592]
MTPKEQPSIGQQVVNDPAVRDAIDKLIAEVHKEGFQHGYAKAESDFARLLDEWAIEPATTSAVRAKLAVILALLRDNQ